jgi:hypothetical protein
MERHLHRAELRDDGHPLLNWGGLPIFANYTQIYMPALGSYFATWFPLFLVGAVFGKLMDESGSARAIVHKILGWVAAERAILAVVLACALLTYGGVSLFLVAFSVYPIAASLFREAAIPKRLIPAAIGLGDFTFTKVAFPVPPRSRTRFQSRSSRPPSTPHPAWVLILAIIAMNRTRIQDLAQTLNTGITARCYP